jgi:hypothetical protein
MLVPKTVQVEQSVEDIMEQIVVVVEAVKGGESVAQAALAEVGKLAQLISDFQSLPADVGASFSGTLNAVLLNGVALATALLGKS